jgi:hypothetical protein
MGLSLKMRRRWLRPVPHLVFVVFLVCSPRQILDSVVVSDPVKMTGLHAIWTRADKCLQNQPMDKKCEPTSVRTS